MESSEQALNKEATSTSPISFALTDGRFIREVVRWSVAESLLVKGIAMSPESVWAKFDF